MTKTRSVFLVLLPFLFIHAALAQTSHTISGTVREKKSGESLIGATVYLLEIPKSGTMSNSYGFYSTSAPQGIYTLIASFAGYHQDTIHLTLDRNISTVIELNQKATELEEVVVSSKKRNENVTRPLAGVQKLSVSDIKNVPVIFGERDILKTIQLFRVSNRPVMATVASMYAVVMRTRT